MKKIVLCLSIMILAVSCGTKGGGSSGTSDNSATGTIENSVSNCAVKFNKEDPLDVIAIKANQARVECRLSEEKILELVKN